jgi:glutamate decarboxylase
MPPDLQDISVLRVVVRNGMSRDMATMLINDLKAAVTRLEQRGAVPEPPGGDEARAGFHH